VLLVFKSVFAAALGAALGLGATYLAVDRGLAFGTTQIGPWKGQTRTGGRDVDPYTLAARARNGSTPLGPGEGLAFLADRDDDGRRLESRCDYAVIGDTPAARFWTLSILNPDGSAPALPLDQPWFTSSELVRGAQGDFSIAVAARARPGNWLPAPKDAPFVLQLRLYDTPASAATGSLAAAGMPSIRRGRCE